MSIHITNNSFVNGTLTLGSGVTQIIFDENITINDISKSIVPTSNVTVIGNNYTVTIDCHQYPGLFFISGNYSIDI